MKVGRVPQGREAIAPVVASVADKISSLVDWFEHLSSGTKHWLGVAAGIAATLGPFPVPAWSPPRNPSAGIR